MNPNSAEAFELVAYYCNKCDTVHTVDSAIGKRHFNLRGDAPP